jgi:hypothetical protein
VCYMPNMAGHLVTISSWHFPSSLKNSFWAKN